MAQIFIDKSVLSIRSYKLAYSSKSVKICAICGIIKIHVIRHFHDVAKKNKPFVNYYFSL